jgi:hypothetical protein
VRPALVAFASVFVLASRAGAAHAQAQEGMPFEDPYDLPNVPRPPTLPELTHPDIEGTSETTAGALIPPPGGVWTHAYVERLDAEMPLALRRWYVGASYEAAVGGTRNDTEVIGSNFAIHGRTLWATRTGLGFGGGMELMLPTATFDPNGRGGAVALSASTLRPWDVTYFIPGIIGVRPFVDLRVLKEPFIFQFRQGLDGTVSVSQLGDRRLYAHTGFYFGWAVTPHVAAGLEAFEEYAIDVPNVRDGAREAIVISPHVRITLPWVQPAISFFTNVGPPLYGASQSIWGIRFAFTVVYDPTAMLRVRPR